MKIYGKVSPLDGFSHRGLKLGLILVLYDLANGKNQYGIFYGKLYNSRNRTFSLENGKFFASCWIGTKIKILQMKWFYETELKEIYFYRQT